MNSTNLASRLEIFFGEANEAEARIYARLPSDAPLEGYKLSGRLVGPECRFAKTLPATIPFIDRGPGKGLLAEAIVPDPCFWKPELPFLYRAIVEVYSSRSVVRPVITAERDDYTLDRPFGIRRLGAIGRSLYLDGKRWVARGACVDRATESDLLAARDASAALMLPAPGDAFCVEASRLGVPLFVCLRGDGHVAASLQDAPSESRRDSSTCQSQLATEIRRLAQWPAVFAIILDRTIEVSDEALAARNTLLATHFGTEPPAWAQLAIFNIGPSDSSIPSLSLEARSVSEGSAMPQSDSSIPTLDGSTIPMIAVRRLPEPASIADSRAACDRLQFDLAAVDDFAGYFV